LLTAMLQMAASPACPAPFEVGDEVPATARGVVLDDHHPRLELEHPVPQVVVLPVHVDDAEVHRRVEPALREDRVERVGARRLGLAVDDVDARAGVELVQLRPVARVGLDQRRRPAVVDQPARVAEPLAVRGAALEALLVGRADAAEDFREQPSSPNWL
jgi:hypothetical protein